MPIKPDWWPKELVEFSKENLMKSSFVKVAEITKPFKSDSDKQIYTILIPLDKASEILSGQYSLGFPLSTSGPHSTSIPSGKPWFRFGQGEQGFEPLVVSWEEGGHRVLLPDQGFLMTYGLVPRVLKSENSDKIVWDDLSIPLFDIVRTKSTSIYQFAEITPGYVEVRNEYLQDYATSRNMIIAQVYFIHCEIEFDEDIEKLLGDSGSVESNGNGRMISISKNDLSDNFYCQVWGVREICSPGPSPIIGEYFNIKDLKWPGIEAPINNTNYSDYPGQMVYVKDSVLGKYEEYPELYRVHPDSGGVSYGTRWSVSYSQRVGRDMIGLELKKLYEGNGAHVIKHWHQYAIDPQDIGKEKGDTTNVALRSLRIAEGLFKLGNLIAQIEYMIVGSNSSPVDITGYDEKLLRYNGLWSNAYLRRVSNHIELDIGQDTFFRRCVDLENAITEGIKERFLRRLLINMGLDAKSIKELRSLKLLYTLVVYSQIALDTGLDYKTDISEIDKRRKEQQPDLNKPPFFETPMKSLFKLHDFRTNAAHRGDQIQELLDQYSIDRASLDSGWGSLLDNLYDDLGDSLDGINSVLDQAIRQMIKR